jgi:hypothetical protein
MLADNQLRLTVIAESKHASWLGVQEVIKYWGLAGINLKASIASASTIEFRM